MFPNVWIICPSFASYLAPQVGTWPGQAILTRANLPSILLYFLFNPPSARDTSGKPSGGYGQKSRDFVIDCLHSKYLLGNTSGGPCPTCANTPPPRSNNLPNGGGRRGTLPLPAEEKVHQRGWGRVNRSRGYWSGPISDPQLIFEIVQFILSIQRAPLGAARR